MLNRETHRLEELHMLLANPHLARTKKEVEASWIAAPQPLPLRLQTSRSQLMFCSPMVQPQDNEEVTTEKRNPRFLIRAVLNDIECSLRRARRHRACTTDQYGKNQIPHLKA